MARMSCAALEFPCKGVQETLLDTLVAAGSIEAEAAEAFRSPTTESGGGSGGSSGSGGDISGDVPIDFPNAFYTQAAWAPDFGVRTGARLTRQESDPDHGIHCFYYLDYKLSDVEAYRVLLEESGFLYNPELAGHLPDFDVPEGYLNEETGHCIVLDVDSQSGEFMIYTY